MLFLLRFSQLGLQLWQVRGTYYLAIYWVCSHQNEKAIAVQTFCVLVLRWSIPNYISKLVVFVIWIFITLIIVIPFKVTAHMNERLYGSVGYCKLCILGHSSPFTSLKIISL